MNEEKRKRLNKLLNKWFKGLTLKRKRELRIEYRKKVRKFYEGWSKYQRSIRGLERR